MYDYACKFSDGLCCTLRPGLIALLLRR